MTTRTLNERQIRWSQFLSNFEFKLQFRPGRQAAMPDALSRCEQDMPKDVDDERLKSRDLKLIKDIWLFTVSSKNSTNKTINVETKQIPDGKKIFLTCTSRDFGI